jgi:hypothetical protein
MTWLKSQLGTVLTAVTLLIAVGISFGRLDARQDELCVQLQAKADKSAVQREMDQIQMHLSRIESKIDQVILGLPK